VKRLTNGSLRHEYNLTDHLGNARVFFADTNSDGTAEILQESHYYAFGMRIEGLGTQSDNKFLYNGKELTDDFGLNWYEYGWRMYDPQIGRWHQVDPIDEFHSPYCYVGNNPTNFVDPDGLGSDDPPVWDSETQTWVFPEIVITPDWNDELADYFYAHADNVASMVWIPIVSDINYSVWESFGNMFSSNTNLSEKLYSGTNLAMTYIPIMPKGMGNTGSRFMLRFNHTASKWVSPSGLIYGMRRDGTNAITHVLEHLLPNSAKANHTIFNVSRSELLPLLDEAWAKRGSAVLHNGLDTYVVEMGRVIGTNGETRIRFVMLQGSNELITAYPWPH
jgi:RHS repeat-associated protein